MDRNSVWAHSYYFVRDTILELDKHPNAYLSTEDLDEIGITVCNMVTETGTPEDSEPQFGVPYTKYNFGNLLEDKAPSVSWQTHRDSNDYYAAYEITNIFNEYLGLENFESDLDTFSSWNTRGMGSTPFETLYCVHSPGEQWAVRTIFDANKASMPHLARNLLQKSKAENRLLRSEVLCALSLMAGRLRLNKYAAYRVIPVFVYSFCGRQARIIQAHYDGPTIVIRKTQYIDLEKENMENVELLLRWMMNKPMGETRYQASQLDKLPIVPSRR